MMMDEAVLCLAVSHESDMVASGAQDGKIQVALSNPSKLSRNVYRRMYANVVQYFKRPYSQGI